jgi:BRCT domain type II-containing protein
MPTVTIATQDAVSAPANTTATQRVVTSHLSAIAAQDAAKLAKQNGHHAFAVGTECVIILGDSDFGAHIDAKKLKKHALDAIEKDGIDANSLSHARGVVDTASTAMRATAQSTWTEKFNAATEAATATGWRRAALLRLACKGK